MSNKNQEKIDMSDVPENLGVIPDLRPIDLKHKDYKHSELASSAGAPVWKKKAKKDWRFFSKRNQAQSSSCMAQSGVKVLGIENAVETASFIDLSALRVYDSRVNYPSGGMSLFDVLETLTEPTACLEVSLPSQGMSETEMNSRNYSFTEAMKKEAEMYKAGGFVTFDLAFINGRVTKPIDIDAVAAIIEQGKAVEAIFFFMGSEYWKNKPKITDHKLTSFEGRTSRHGIALTDYFLDEDGKKCFLAEDSAGNNSSIDKKGWRIITEDFFKERCYGAGYLLYKENKEMATSKPKHFFTKTLKYGAVDEQVRWLQEVLVYEGFMPAIINNKDFVPTKNFKGMTHGGVLKWQTKHGLVSDGIVGPKSRAVLNNLYK